MTLRDTTEHWRLEHLIECLQEKRESVASLGLTLEGLRKILELPLTDREIFERLLREKLNLVSDTEPIAESLSPGRKQS